MNKGLTVSILVNILLIILPLALRPYLIFNYKIIIIIVGSILLWLTQPTFSVTETQEKKSSDKMSVLIILVMSFISVIVPISIWAYSSSINKDSFNGITFAGIVLIAAGILLRAWAVRSLGVYFTPTVQIQSEHKLITTGPYKLIRHPSYSGAFLAITSGALILNTIAGYFTAVTAMSVCYTIRIYIEEKELLSHFGNQYLQYSKKTKKLIPFLL